MSVHSLDQNPQNVNQLTPADIQSRLETVERELADMRARYASLEAAYDALKHENMSQATDLFTWNTIYEGDRLAEQAEGR